MRNVYFTLFLFFAGCSNSNYFQYDPVDWNSTAPVLPEKTNKVELIKEVESHVQKLLVLHNEQRDVNFSTLSHKGTKSRICPNFFLSKSPSRPHT